MGVRRGVRRVPLREASELLGVSKDALRQRIRRDTIRSDKGEDGRVYVYLDPSLDKVHAEGGVHDGPGSDERYVRRLEEEVEYLRRYLDEEREARRRADTILVQLSQANAEQARTIRALEAPAAESYPEEPPVAPEAATEQPGRVEPQAPLEGSQMPTEATDEQQGRGPVPDTEAPQESSEAEPRSWWQRMFGG